MSDTPFRGAASASGSSAPENALPHAETPSTPPPPASVSQSTDPTRRVVTNLVLLACLGILVSAWILFYTDWFPVVGGVLGLGGLFAWAAFLGGLLTEDRKKSLQAAFERSVLTDRRAARAALVLGGVVLLWASLHGSLVLDSRGDDRGRLLAVVPWGAPFGPQRDRDYLLPHMEQKRLVFTGWWRRDYAVNVSGLPSAPLTIWPLQRQRLVVPATFAARLVLLVRLSPTHSANAARASYAFVVKRSGKTIGTIPASRYRGEAVWVGCDVDVEIPERVVNRWSIDLARSFEHSPNAVRQQEVFNRWVTPQATGDAILHPGDEIEVSLVACDPKERQVACRKKRLSSSVARTGNVQEIYLGLSGAPGPDAEGDLGEECSRK